METPGTSDARCLGDEQPSEADIDLYRVLSADISTGVAVVSTLLHKRDYAATVTAFLSVSYDPPTMLVSHYAGSGIGDAIAVTGPWALSLLDVGGVLAMGGDAPAAEIPDPLIHFASAYHRLAP